MMLEYHAGLFGMVAMLLMLLMRLPVAFTMFLVGFWNRFSEWLEFCLVSIGVRNVHISFFPELIVIPLFIFMGNIASKSGMSSKLFDAPMQL